MASSNRVVKDKAGHIFMPMNVEGGNWNENFITTTKLAIIVGIVASAVAIGIWLGSLYSGPTLYFIMYGLWAWATYYITRFFIFEEKYYYKMYQKLKKHDITTPALFWDVASIKETSDGSIMTYTDGKVGVILKLDRDTITGKDKDFKEQHYDAISDFYKSLVDNKYKFVQMNIMEIAGKDPRLAELDKLINKDSNPNIIKLMENEVGHIKNITNKTLYETDYVLIYTDDVNRVDDIVNDVIDCVYRILDGAFVAYRLLNNRDIIEFIKEEFGIKYFSVTEATLELFSNSNNMVKPFMVSGIAFDTGEYQEIGKEGNNRIANITSDVLSGNRDIEDYALKDTFLSKENKNNIIDFDELIESGFGLGLGSSENSNKEKDEDVKVKKSKSIGGKLRGASLRKRKAYDENFQLEENYYLEEGNSQDNDDDFLDF